MKFRMLGPLTAAFFLCFLSGCGGVEFKEFTSPEGKFSILMPANPEKKTQDVLGQTMVAYGKNVRNGAYVVGYFDVPAGVPVSLPGAAQGAANTAAGKVTTEREFTFEGNKGLEFEAETTKPKGYVSGRVIVINNRFYQLLAMGNNARLTDGDVQKFLTSFKLTK